MSCLIQATSDDFYVCYSLESTGWVLNHVDGSICMQISCQGEPVHAFLYLFLKSQSSEVTKEGNKKIVPDKAIKEITFFDLSIIQLMFFEPLVSSTSFRKWTSKHGECIP